MQRNFFRRMHGEIPAGESLEEPLNFRFRSSFGLPADLVEQERFIRNMQAVAVHGAAEMVGGGNKQLPQHFRFPGSQRLWIYGVNVGVGQQAEALQALLAAHGGGESGNRGRIENVAPLNGRGHIEMVLNQEMDF